MDWEGCPSGFALRVAPYGDQKIREAVEDCRLVHETLSAVDEPDENMLETAVKLADQGHLDEAAQRCETLLSKQTDQAGAYYLLGIIRQAAGNLPEAEKLYRKSIYLEPGHYQALAQLATLCQQKGDAASAKRLSERATRAQERSSVRESDS